MSEKVFFPVPCTPKIGLRLKKEKLTFYNEYSGRNVLTSKTVAQIGFDLCENSESLCENITENFKSVSGITLSDEILASSKYSPVESKVFGIVNENTAVYSLGILLRDLLISTGRSDLRLRAILDKACDRYSFTRYNSFCELKEDLAIYLKTEVDEETYGVIIAADKPLPEPIFSHSHRESKSEEIRESVHFASYSRAEEMRYSISKHLTIPRVQAVLTAFFILFSSISIPITSTKKAMQENNGLPTAAYYETK